METEIVNYIIYIGGGGAVAGLVFGILVGIFRVGSWYGSTNARFGGLDEKFSDVRESISGILEELRHLGKRVDELFTRLPSNAAYSRSPVHLTELGQKAATAAGAGEWADAHVDEVRRQTEGMDDYDAQQFCFGYATEDRLGEARLKLAKEAAFKSGITLGEVLFVFGIVLRDQLIPPERLTDL